MSTEKPNVYIQFGDTLQAVSEEWDDSEYRYMRNKGSVDRYHEVVDIAYKDAIDRNADIPYLWGLSRGISEGMAVFGALSFMKAAAFGYADGDRSDLHDYVRSNDGLRYASKLAVVPGIVAGTTEISLGLSNHPEVRPADFMVTSGKVTMADGKLTIPAFDSVRAEGIEYAVKENFDMNVKCEALIHRAFPIIYRAVNTLAVNSGLADDAFDRFAAMKKAA